MSSHGRFYVETVVLGDLGTRKVLGDQVVALAELALQADYLDLVLLGLVSQVVILYLCADLFHVNVSWAQILNLLKSGDVLIYIQCLVKRRTVRNQVVLRNQPRHG